MLACYLAASAHGVEIRPTYELSNSQGNRRQPQFEMAANKEEQKPQKASKYYPAEDVAVPKKVSSPMRCPADAPQEEVDWVMDARLRHDCSRHAQKMQDRALELHCLEHC
jgi:hypothetical protein